MPFLLAMSFISFSVVDQCSWKVGWINSKLLYLRHPFESSPPPWSPQTGPRVSAVFSINTNVRGISPAVNLRPVLWATPDSTSLRHPSVVRQRLSQTVTCKTADLSLIASVQNLKSAAFFEKAVHANRIHQWEDAKRAVDFGGLSAKKEGKKKNGHNQDLTTSPKSFQLWTRHLLNTSVKRFHRPRR